MPFALAERMQVTQRVMRYGKKRAMRKLVRAMPWLGGVVAVATLGQAMRRKGVFAGAIDTALDMLPFVGGAKNVYEVVCGRDLFPERPRPVQ